MSKRGNRIVVIGTGFVGSSYAFSLMNQGSIAEELVLIDANAEKAEGDAMDLAHGQPFAGSKTTVWQGEFADCGEADLVVITAGSGQKQGETRLDLLERNAHIMKSIVDQVMHSGFDGIFLVASNPVDLLTHLVWTFSGLPKERVIGTGTLLDTARFRYRLGDYFKIDPRNVHAYIIGEHGDSELPVWSQADIGGKKINDWLHLKEEWTGGDLETIFEEVRDAAYAIIDRKGATFYGIAMGMVRLTKAILQNENSILTVSCYLDGQYGHKGLFIGVPAVVNRSGLHQIIEIDLNEKEKELFSASFTTLQRSLEPVLERLGIGE